MEAFKIKPKQITEEMVIEYLNLAEVIRGLEKKKEELRKSILFAYPQGGEVGEYKIDIKQEDGRRSFKFDDAKATVSEKTWLEVYMPFIKIGDIVKKLIITKLTS